MKKLILILGFLLTFLLQSCHSSYVYDFEIPMLIDYSIHEYISSEDLEFMRIDGVAIVPTIQAIKYEDSENGTQMVYAVYMNSYSVFAVENLSITGISIYADDGTELYTKSDLDHCVMLEYSSDTGAYEESFIYAEFLEQNVIDKSNGKFSLVVCVQMDNAQKHVEKELVFDFIVKTYTRPILPT